MNSLIQIKATIRRKHPYADAPAILTDLADLASELDRVAADLPKILVVAAKNLVIRYGEAFENVRSHEKKLLSCIFQMECAVQDQADSFREQMTADKIRVLISRQFSVVMGKERAQSRVWIAPLDFFVYGIELAYSVGQFMYIVIASIRKVYYGETYCANARTNAEYAL